MYRALPASAPRRLLFSKCTKLIDRSGALYAPIGLRTVTGICGTSNEVLEQQSFPARTSSLSLSVPRADGIRQAHSVPYGPHTFQGKTVPELRLRCTQVDENGLVKLKDEGLTKRELSAKYKLLPRDLRKIDTTNVPRILIRESAILLDILPLKVLIKRDSILLFEAYDTDTPSSQSAFIQQLYSTIQEKQSHHVARLPYGVRALEAVLLSAMAELEDDLQTIRKPAADILWKLEEDIDQQTLRMLLLLSKRVRTFERRARLVRDAMGDILDAEDTLAALYLAEKVNELFRGVENPAEVEMLLDSFYIICDEMVQEAQDLASKIKYTDEIVRIILDANRNSLILLRLKLTVCTLSIGMGTWIGCFYGMNIQSVLSKFSWGLPAVTLGCVLIASMTCRYGLRRLEKIQTVKVDSSKGVMHRV